MPKVSVIMGVYNNRDTVGESIGSILAQTFSDWEFVICDDGSRDGTWEQLETFRRQYPQRFRLLRNRENRGLARCLNRCLFSSTGRYIARMDGDDRSHPRRLEKQVDFLDSHPHIDFVSCNYTLFDSTGVWGERKLKENPEKQDFFPTSPFCHAATLFRRSSLERVGGYRDTQDTLRCEDYDLFMRMYAAGQRGWNLQEPLYQVYEGKEAYARKKYRYRLTEARVRRQGFEGLGLLPKGWPYVIKPLLVGLLPPGAVRRIRKIQENGRNRL